MFNIIVKRQKEYTGIQKPNKTKIEGSTIGVVNIVETAGRFYPNGSEKILWECFSLENEGESTDTAGQDKRIIAREYNIEWTTTSVCVPKSFKEQGILLSCDSVLPSFRRRRILIHIGNYPQDTLGCLLFGYKDNGNGTIGKSTDAITDFYNFVKEREIGNFRLIIKEI